MPEREAGNAGIDMQAMTEDLERLAAPGAPHRRLAALAGIWDASLKSWADPGSPAVEAFGTCQHKMILGGRFLWQELTADIMGTSFSGVGITGFDNTTHRYVSAWVDSMSTGIVCFEGSLSPDGKTIIQEADYNDPVKGTIKWRSCLHFLDDDTINLEMYRIDENGTDSKIMEIMYTRQC